MRFQFGIEAAKLFLASSELLLISTNQRQQCVAVEAVQIRQRSATHARSMASGVCECIHKSRMNTAESALSSVFGHPIIYGETRCHSGCSRRNPTLRRGLLALMPTDAQSTEQGGRKIGYGTKEPLPHFAVILRPKAHHYLHHDSTRSFRLPLLPCHTTRHGHEHFPVGGANCAHTLPS